ncbi:MAG: methylenetetrahydrofolate reductase [NAD(P)H] [Pseudomonadota bacterium]
MSSPSLSFEFFPPQSPAASLRLWTAVQRLAPFAPSFVSVTYGAGGTTRDRTKTAIATIRERARLSVAGHLTCVGATRDETLSVVDDYRKLGVTHVVALRGDPPKGADRFEAHPEGFSGSVELVSALKARGDMKIVVGAYPERHPEATSADADVEHLKRKMDAGADAAITQFFFDNEDFYRFRDRAVAAGVTIPIWPGILPVENFTKLQGFAKRCGANIPDWMHAAFANAQTDEDATLLATAIASEQCTDLLEHGVDHLHLYTLNLPDLTAAVCQSVGFEPVPISGATASA